MLIPLLLLAEIDLTLTAVALGGSLSKRNRAFTVAATALVALAIALSMVLIWVLWSAAPGCLGDANPAACTAARLAGPDLLYVSEITLIQWFWMLGVALVARFVAERSLARVSG